jgi:hypothetical protein
LETQTKVLNGLAEEHLSRSTDPARAGSPEKNRWEADLAQELRQKSAALLAQLNEATRQRLAFEAAHGPIAAAALGKGALDDTKAASPDEFAYLYKVDERLLRVRQELEAVQNASKGFYAQLATNTTAEAVGRVSLLLEENGKQARQWEREEADLELRRLEFRALRK